MPSLDGVIAKRNRAKAHLEEVKRQIDAFKKADDYAVIVEPYPEEGRYLIRLAHLTSVPLVEIAVAIGDCVHNMRCALDYIAWELAGANPKDTTTMFPICDTAAKFRDHGKGRIKNVPTVPAGLIEKMQPYNAGGDDSALWAIEYLDSRDKHKLLTETSSVAHDLFAYPSPIPDGVDLTLSLVKPFADLKENAVVAVLPLTPPAPNSEIHAVVATQVAFANLPGGESVPRRHVVPNLEILLQEVDLVIGTLKPHFSSLDYLASIGRRGLIPALSATFVVGKLLLQVYSDRDFGNENDVTSSRGPGLMRWEDTFLLRVWPPIQGVGLIWPPRHTIDDTMLSRLSARFATAGDV